MEQTSSILTQLEELLDNVKDIAESAASEIVTSAEKNALAYQVNQLLEELIQFSNTKYQQKFVFGGTETLSGTQTNAQPFNIRMSGASIIGIIQNPNGITGQMKRLISDGKTMTINISGADIFQPNGEAGEYDIFNTLINLRENLKANDSDSIRLRINEIKSEYDKVSSQNTIAGAKINRMQLIKDQLDDLKLIQKSNLSSIEDTDVADAIMRLRTAEVSFQAALETSSRILKESLLDYI